MLRRGYTFTDGNDRLGRLDAGLFFVAFVRDPRTQFVPVQTCSSRQDGLMEYLTHTGSGLFAVPPGVSRSASLVTGPGRHAGDHRRQPVRGAASCSPDPRGNLARVTSTAARRPFRPHARPTPALPPGCGSSRC